MKNLEKYPPLRPHGSFRNGSGARTDVELEYIVSSCEFSNSKHGEAYFNARMELATRKFHEIVDGNDILLYSLLDKHFSEALRTEVRLLRDNVFSLQASQHLCQIAHFPRLLYQTSSTASDFNQFSDIPFFYGV